MFLEYDYGTKTLTNTIEQLVIADNVIHPLEKQNIDGMIEKAVALVFNFDFPFYADADSPEYAAVKLAFEKTFCLQYFREQIGLETIGEFQYHLKKSLRLTCHITSSYTGVLLLSTTRLSLIRVREK